MKLVLDDLVKQLRFLAVAPIIAAALLEHVCNLLISPPLTGLDFPDFFQQLVEIILAELPPVLEQLIVENKPLDDVFPQGIRRPNPKVRRLDGIDPVSHGNHRVQIVKAGCVPFAISGSCFQNGNNCIFDKFPGFKDVFKVFVDSRCLYAEKVGHGPLGQAKIVLRKHHVYGHFSIRSLIEHHLGLG